MLKDKFIAYLNTKIGTAMAHHYNYAGSSKLGHEYIEGIAGDLADIADKENLELKDLNKDYLESIEESDKACKECEQRNKNEIQDLKNFNNDLIDKCAELEKQLSIKINEEDIIDVLKKFLILQADCESQSLLKGGLIEDIYKLIASEILGGK